MVSDHKVCIIMLGESGVGKTSLMLRFCKNRFREDYGYTSIDYYHKTIVLNDKNVELELWDTAGQERFRSIIKEYFRRADGALLVYDMTNLDSFRNLSSWLDVFQSIKEEITVVVVGNKADLESHIQVPRSIVETFVKDKNLDFWEASAKNNENVEEVFKNLTSKILERKRISPFCTVLENDESKSESSITTVSDSNQRNSDKSLVPIIAVENVSRSQSSCC